MYVVVTRNTNELVSKASTMDEARRIAKNGDHAVKLAADWKGPR